MSDIPKVLIVATHPVQYQVPWFRYLHNNIQNYSFEILYLTLPNAQQQGIGFGQSFEWDIPLLDGYNWKQVDSKYLKGDGGIEKFFSIRLTNTKKLINSFNPNIVLTTGWQCMGLIQILLATKQLDIPLLIRAESNNLKPRSQYKKIIHRRLVNIFDHFLCIGTANKMFYLQNGISEENTFSCPYFVDNDFFENKSKSYKNHLQQLKNDWHVGQDSFCFCYVGKLNPKKRIMDVLEAFNNLDNNQTHLLVVGDGELMQQAIAYVDKFKLNVTFTGFLNQSEITKAYSISNCLVLASDYDETWGLVVNEAMASGLPAIVSNRCGCHLDLVINNESGYIFDFANIDSLTKNMKRVISLDDQAFKNLSNTAKANVLENYSIEKASEGFIKALDNSLKVNKPSNKSNN